METPSENGHLPEPELEAEQTSTVKERIDGALAGTARLLEQVATRVERYADGSAVASDYAARAASSLHASAQTLSDTKTDDLLEHSADLVRRNPLVSLGIAFGVGFIAARLIRR
jgi:ElaB/YqjD/DUF883 family membrane-anchored ribosome-binding protein